jgi:hypothetical protein
MAKINFGPVVNDARGKVNGVVMSKNRSGAYVRTKVTPTNPRTAAQVAVRSNLSIFSQMWSGTLTAAQRAAWVAFANTYPINNIFGNSIKLNGLNMVVRINGTLAQIGVPAISTPPGSPATTPIPMGPIVTWSPATLSVTQQANPPTAGTVFYVFATPSLPAGRNPTPSDYRFISSPAPLVAGTPGPVDFYTGYYNVFGTPIAGKAVGLLIATIDPTVGIATVAEPFYGIIT